MDKGSRNAIRNSDLSPDNPIGFLLEYWPSNDEKSVFGLEVIFSLTAGLVVMLIKSMNFFTFRGWYV